MGGIYWRGSCTEKGLAVSLLLTSEMEWRDQVGRSKSSSSKAAADGSTGGVASGLR
jgi:hypothetical protein